MRKVILTIACGLVCMSITTGCASWTSDKPKSKNSMWSSMQFWKKKYQTPTQLAAIWTPDTLTMTGKPPTRGFGGRLYFYNADSKAISVEGELIVHGYEESKILGKAQPGKREADKTFVFTKEQFSSHFSPSELGASYSVWIPWDGEEGIQREICLIPSFKSSDGAIVQGEPAKLVLQGRSHDPAAEFVKNRVSIQESQSPTVTADLPHANRGMRTTTISVPSQASRLGTLVKSTQNSPSSTSTTINGNAYGGVAVGGGASGSGTSQMTTVVNDLNSNPLAQRSYNLTANANAYATAMSSSIQSSTNMPAQPNGTVTPNHSVVPSSMPNMIQSPHGGAPGFGTGTISPAAFQNILPPQATPNQAFIPAMPNQIQPGQFPQQQSTPGQTNTQQWQPYGQQPIPLINPNTLHYSPTVPASATGMQTNQVHQAGFSGYQPPNAVTTAGGQFPLGLPGQQ
jgi:hypothetical protein